MCNSFIQEDKAFISHSTLQTLFCRGLIRFGELILDKCWGDFVCVYDQNYVLVIVTQPKQGECAINLDMKTQFSLLI